MYAHIILSVPNIHSIIFLYRMVLSINLKVFYLKFNNIATFTTPNII